jgi:CHASE3 domain sensor protein
LSLIFAGLLVLLIGILAYNSWAAFRRNSAPAAFTRQVIEKTNSLLSS